jgi:hypothetical protein
MNVKLFRIFKAYHQGSLVSKTKIEDSVNQIDYSFLEMNKNFKDHKLYDCVF